MSLAHNGAQSRDTVLLQVVSPLQEALMALKGYRNGIWIEIWDVPNLLDKNATWSDVHGKRLIHALNLQICYLMQSKAPKSFTYVRIHAFDC